MKDDKKKKSRGATALLVLLFTAVSLAGGCGKKSGENETPMSVVSKPTELTMIFADGDEGAKAAVNEVVRRFNEAYPDITLYVEPTTAGSSYSAYLKTKDSVGELPDIMEMRDTAVYVRAGKLSPLPEDIVSLFSDTETFDGQVYTSPFGMENPQGIFYNKAYFEGNGWTEPETYEEFLQLCDAVSEKGEMAPLAVGGGDEWHMGFLFQMAYNDRVLSQDADFIRHCYEGTKDFSDRCFQEACMDLQTLFSYAREGWAKTPDAELGSLLAEGEAAMVFTGIQMITAVSDAYPDFDMGWFAVPCHDGKLRMVGGVSANGLAISAEAAEDPDKKAAAEEFLRFFFKKENYSSFCEAICTIPALKEPPEITGHPLLQEVCEDVAAADETFLMWNQMDGDNELPVDFRDFTYATLIKMLQGEITVSETCAQLNRRWEALTQAFNPLEGAAGRTDEKE